MSSSNVSKIVSDFLSGAELTSEGPSTFSADEVVRADASTESEALEDYGTDAKSSESTVEDLLPGSEDAPQDQSSKASPKADGKQTASAKEVITVTDENGKRRKVEIDYSDRASIKKAHEMMYGARKWQADRDRAIQAEKSAQSELQQIKQDWEVLDKAFQAGPEHLFDILQGRQGAFKEYLSKQLERQEFLKNASPEEIKALEAQERADSHARELERLRKDNEEFKKQVMAEKQAAEDKALESKVHPVFDKYRFADKLGNSDDEHMFDSMLWNSALERLGSYEEKGLDLTPELIEREFKNVSSALRNRIGVQAEKRAAKVVEQKKREATENVQAKVMSGYKTGGTAQEARDLMKKGDLTSLLKGWGKYGSLFNSSKK